MKTLSYKYDIKIQRNLASLTVVIGAITTSLFLFPTTADANTHKKSIKHRADTQFTAAHKKQADEFTNPIAYQSVLPSGFTVQSEKDGIIIAHGGEGTAAFNTAGKLLIPRGFGQLSYVGEQLFVASKFQDDGTTNCFLLDRHGRLVAKLPSWTRVDNKQFCEGLLNIGEDFSPTAFINRQGKVLKNFDQYIDVKEFSCGLAAASYDGRDGRWSGYINHDGIMTIGPYRNTDLTKFENNVAIATFNPDKAKSYSRLISNTGKFLLPLKYDYLGERGDGTYLGQRAGSYVVLRPNGSIIAKFPAGCTDITQPDKLDKNALFGCGFGGTVQRKSGIGKVGSKWGYCDLTGKLVIPARFAFAQAFNGEKGVAYISADDKSTKCGVIDRKGKWITPPKYESFSVDAKGNYVPGSISRSEDGQVVPTDRNRAEVFESLLRKHNFIGMPLPEVQGLLKGLQSYLSNSPSPFGERSISFSLTPNAFCGTGSSSIELSFDKNDLLIGWRANHGGISNNNVNLVTENVIVEDSSKGFIFGNLAPKNN